MGPDSDGWHAHQPVCPQGDQRVESEQRRGGSQDSEIGPLPWRLDTEIGDPVFVAAAARYLAKRGR